MKYFEVLFYVNGKIDHVEYRGVPALTHMFALDNVGFVEKFERIDKRLVKAEEFLSKASLSDFERFNTLKVYNSTIAKKTREKRYLFCRKYTLQGTNLNKMAIAEKLNSEDGNRKKSLKRLFGDVSFEEMADIFVEHAKDMIKNGSL